jgi:hypothetical protein
LNDVRELAYVLIVLLDGIFELLDLAFAEGLHHEVEPLEVSALQRVYYVFVQQFSDVENVLAEEDGHTHFDGEFTLLLLTEVLWRRVRQVLEAAFVIVFVIVFSLVVKSMNMRESGVNFRVDVRLLLDLLSDIGKHLEAIVVETKIVLLLCLRD